MPSEREATLGLTSNIKKYVCKLKMYCCLVAYIKTTHSMKNLRFIFEKIESNLILLRYTLPITQPDTQNMSTHF